MKWLFAALVIVNLAVFLWPAGDKEPFFDSRVEASAPAVNESSMLLLTETDFDQPAQPANAPQPVTPRGVQNARQVASVADDSARSEPSESPDVAESAPAAPAVTPIVMPAMTMSKPTAAAKSSVPSSGLVARSSADVNAESATASGPAITPVAAARKKNTETTETKVAVSGPARKPQASEKTAASDRANDTVAEKAATPPESRRAKPEREAPGADRAVARPKVARVAPQAAPASGVCLRFGPFQSEQGPGELVAELNERGTPFRDRFVDAREVRTWRVYVGPLNNDAEVAAMESDLSAAGVTDRYIAAEKNGSRIVSLGVFSASKSAESVKVLLSRKSIEALVRPEMRKLKATRWVEIASPGLDDAGAAVLASRPLLEKRARARRIQCSPAAG